MSFFLCRTAIDPDAVHQSEQPSGPVHGLEVSGTRIIVKHQGRISRRISRRTACFADWSCRPQHALSEQSMLRQLAALCRPLAQQHSLQLSQQSVLAVHSRHSFYGTPGAHGLEEFFEAPLSEEEKPRTGDCPYRTQYISLISCLALWMTLGCKFRY